MPTDTVYDLGTAATRPELDLTEPPPAAPPLAIPPALPARGLAPTETPASRSAVGAASLSLIAPGAGHLLQTRYQLAASLGALSVALGIGGAVLWTSMPRFWKAAEVLGLPAESAVWTLAGMACAFAIVHVFSAVSARAKGHPHRCAPLTAGAASALLPGWGQLIQGHLVRATLLMASVWCIVLAWAVASVPVTEMLMAYKLHLPASLAWLTSQPVRWAAPAAIWPLAIYDAAASACFARLKGR